MSRGVNVRLISPHSCQKLDIPPPILPFYYNSMLAQLHQLRQGRCFRTGIQQPLYALSEAPGPMPEILDPCRRYVLTTSASPRRCSHAVRSKCLRASQIFGAARQPEQGQLGLMKCIKGFMTSLPLGLCSLYTPT